MCVLVELGAGALRKTALLLDALEEIQKPVTYHALDLDRSELERTLAELTGKYKYVKLSGLWGTYDDGRAWLARTHCCLDVPSGQGLRRPVTLLWLGSSIGNMTRLDAAQFIKSFGDILRPGCDTFIVAIDGRDHPTDSIRAAYLDKAGVTASFALNLLDSLNVFVGYNMADRNAFSYHPYYNEIKGRNEAYFRSSKTQEVQLREDVFGSSKTVRLLKGEFIRFAYSHKYNDAERERLFSLSEAVALKEWSAGEGQPYVLSSLGL